jgi:hypothetical protein
MIDQDVMQRALLTSNKKVNADTNVPQTIAFNEGIEKANPEAKNMATANKAIMMMVQAEQKGKEPTTIKFKDGMGEYETSAKEQRALQQMLTKLA